MPRASSQPGTPITEYSVPTSDSGPIAITLGVNQTLWFSEINRDKIGVLAQPNYVLTEYALPTTGSGPAEMSIQPGTSYLWITEQYTGRIARFDMANHSFQEFTPNVSLRYPVGIVADQSGNIWIAEHGGSSIVLFQTSNS